MFWDKFYELCKKNNQSPNQVVAALHISKGSITKWKNGTIPSKTTLPKIAEYFGVTTDYFFSNQSLTSEQIKLIELFNQVPDHQKKTAFALLEALKENSEEA